MEMTHLRRILGVSWRQKLRSNDTSKHSVNRKKKLHAVKEGTEIVAKWEVHLSHLSRQKKEKGIQKKKVIKNLLSKEAF